MTTKTKLFGGAIECTIPEDFADTSEYRDVPDNQEMYIGEVDSLESGFIVELCEMVLPDKDLSLAFEEHVKDIHNAADMSPEDIETLERASEALSGKHYILSVQSIKDPRKGTTLVLIAFFRLVEYTTDVILTQSIVVGKDALAGPAINSLISQAKTSVAACASSFTVLDPGLFG